MRRGDAPGARCRIAVVDILRTSPSSSSDIARIDVVIIFVEIACASSSSMLRSCRSSSILLAHRLRRLRRRYCPRIAVVVGIARVAICVVVVGIARVSAFALVAASNLEALVSDEATAAVRERLTETLGEVAAAARHAHSPVAMSIVVALTEARGPLGDMERASSQGLV